MSFCNDMFYISFQNLSTNNFFNCMFEINLNHFFLCPNSKSQQSVVRKLRLTLQEGVIRISLAQMLEYCALNPRCSISLYETSPLEASLTLSHNCQRITTLMRKGFFNITSDTKETYLATIDQAYLKILIIGPS